MYKPILVIGFSQAKHQAHQLHNHFQSLYHSQEDKNFKEFINAKEVEKDKTKKEIKISVSNQTIKKEKLNRTEGAVPVKK